MGISILCFLITLLSVFMFTAEGVTEEARSVTLVIDVLCALFVIVKVFI